MISNWGYDSDFEAIYNSNKSLYQGLVDKTILITGATGLIGVATTEFLIYLKRVHNIRCTIYILSSNMSNAHKRFSGFTSGQDLHYIESDIRDARFPNHLDYIVHSANIANPKLYEETPVDVIDVTVAGTKNVLEYARNSNSKVLYVSSVEVYGDTENIELPVTEGVFGIINPFTTRSSYTESKRLAETYCKAYSSQFNVNVSVARLSKVYGPSNSESDNRVMSYILKTIKNGEDIVLNSDGSRVFSFCYVTDVVSALMTILLNGGAGEVYNVSDKNSIASLKEIAEMSGKIAGVEVKLQPQGVSQISQDTVVDSTKLENLGWKPITNIPSGLQKQFNAVNS